MKNINIDMRIFFFIKYSRGAVLVFLPGFAEIQQLYESLTTHKVFGSRSGGRLENIGVKKTPLNTENFCMIVKF